MSGVSIDMLPPAPLANSRGSARRSPGWGGGDGRQVMVSRGGGGIARLEIDSGYLGDSTATASSLES